jgi:hypothetical protein
VEQSHRSAANADDLGDDDASSFPHPWVGRSLVETLVIDQPRFIVAVVAHRAEHELLRRQLGGQLLMRAVLLRRLLGGDLLSRIDHDAPLVRRQRSAVGDLDNLVVANVGPGLSR